MERRTQVLRTLKAALLLLCLLILTVIPVIGLASEQVPEPPPVEQSEDAGTPSSAPSDTGEADSRKPMVFPKYT